MLILSSVNDRLQLQLGAGGNVTVHASYLDNVAGAVNPARKNTLITTTALTDIVAPPAASVQRNVKTLHVHNNGGAAVTVAVILTDGTTAVTLASQTLAPNATLQYIDEIGFVLSDFAERMPFLNLTANYTVGFFDRNGIINCNGSFTLGLLAASTAGAGFVFRVRNTGMATVTIDPNASETIDGKASIPCCAKEEFLVACDGTNWITMGRNSLVMVNRGVIAPATARLDVSFPPDYTKFEFEIARCYLSSPGNTLMYISTAGFPLYETTGYYYQISWDYGPGSNHAGEARLNQGNVQFSASSTFPQGDFDSTMDLWPDPNPTVPRAPSFHIRTRSSFLLDGTSLIAFTAGWLQTTVRAKYIAILPTAGTIDGGIWTLRGQIP